MKREPRSSNALSRPRPEPQADETFAREYSATALRTHRRAVLLALVLYLAFAGLDSWMAPAVRNEIWIIRTVVSVSLLVVWLYAFRALTTREVERLLIIAVVSMGAGMLGIIGLSWSSGGRDYSSALVPLILFAHAVVALRYATASILSWSITLAWLWAGVSLVGRDSEILLANALVLVSANLVGMLASYSREKAALFYFQQRERLQEQGERLTQALEQQREALVALRRSEERTRQLVDSMNEGLVIVDAAGLITWVNPSVCEMMGYTEAEVLGHHPMEFLDEENRAVFRRRFAERRLGEKERYEIEWIRKDGSRLYAIISPQPLFSDDGEFTGSLAVFNDITRIKRAEAALERSERYFRELVNHASSIILRWDTSGIIRFINPFGLRLLGYTLEEILGRNVIGTLVPETDSTGKDLVEMIHDITVHPDRYLFNENENLDREGRRYWIVWTNRALTDATGAVTEILSIGTDITELKHAREELAHQRDELAELNRFIRTVFGRYVSEAVVDRLLASPEGLEVGGTRRSVTILVADIRGFSSLCEDLRAEQVVALLNTYLETMTEVIEQFEGTIDEFVGDGILVIFGAPIRTEDHAERAVACGIAMQSAMPRVNAHIREAELPAIEMGIGIETGDVVVGSIGSVRRAKYGVVGTAVNMAARIQAYAVGGEVLISEPTLRQLRDRVHVGAPVRVEPKGSKRPVSLYPVLAVNGAWNLKLERQAMPLLQLSPPLPCQFVLMEQKFAGAEMQSGRIVAVSMAELELECDLPLHQRADLRISFLPQSGARIDDVHAKVVAQIPAHPTRFRLAFTATPPAARKFLKKLQRRPRGTAGEPGRLLEAGYRLERADSGNPNSTRCVRSSTGIDAGHQMRTQ